MSISFKGLLTGVTVTTVLLAAAQFLDVHATSWLKVLLDAVIAAVGITAHHTVSNATQK